MTYIDGRARVRAHTHTDTPIDTELGIANVSSGVLTYLSVIAHGFVIKRICYEMSTIMSEMIRD